MNPFDRKDRYDCVMDISPATAAEWLGRNTHNRKLIDSHVRRLANAMQRGDWKLTKDGVSFDTNGILQDGQHRLTAICKSGKTISLRVYFNEPVENVWVLDTGRVDRSTSDVISLAGNAGSVSKNEMATLRMMLNGLNGRTQRTIQEEAALIATHREAITFSHNLLSRGPRGVCNARTRAVWARAFYSVDHEELKAAAKVLRDGKECERDNPLRMLRDFFQEGGSRKKGDVGESSEYAKTERMLVAYLRHELPQRLTESSREAFPLPGEVAVAA